MSNRSVLENLPSDIAGAIDSLLDYYNSKGLSPKFVPTLTTSKDFNSDLTCASRHASPLSTSAGNHGELVQSPRLQVFEVTDNIGSGPWVQLAVNEPNLRAFHHLQAEVAGLNTAAREPD